MEGGCERIPRTRERLGARNDTTHAAYGFAYQSPAPARAAGSAGPEIAKTSQRL
jgi:hypothetical protein